jgi:hypothetical protein
MVNARLTMFDAGQSVPMNIDAVLSAVVPVAAEIPAWNVGRSRAAHRTTPGAGNIAGVGSRQSR